LPETRLSVGAHGRARRDEGPWVPEFAEVILESTGNPQRFAAVTLRVSGRGALDRFEVPAAHLCRILRHRFRLKKEITFIEIRHPRHILEAIHQNILMDGDSRVRLIVDKKQYCARPRRNRRDSGKVHGHVMWMYALAVRQRANN